MVSIATAASDDDNTRKNTAADAARMPLGMRVALARKEAKMTQKALAEATGVPQPNISLIEGGRLNCTAATYDRLIGGIVEHMGRAPVSLDSIDGTLGIVGRSQGKLGLVTGSQLLDKPIPTDWLVESFVARRRVTLLAGQEGSGKSMVAQTITVALANGDKEAFGFRLPGTPQRVLVIDTENVMMPTDDEVDASLVMERMQHFGLTMQGAENVSVVGTFGFDLDKDSEVLDMILTDAEKMGAPFDVVVFDSFRSLWTSGSENTPDAGRVLQKLCKQAHKHAAAFLVLHHTNKAGAAYSGHTSIGSTVAAVWTFSRLVHKDPETGKKVQHATARFLAPYKVRIAAEPKSRIVKTSGAGIISDKSVADYEAEGFTIDPGTPDEEGE